MEIRLDPDVASRVNELVERSVAPSAEELVNTTLRRYLKKHGIEQRYNDLKRLIQEGVESAERGELHDGEAVFEEILRELDGVISKSA